VDSGLRSVFNSLSRFSVFFLLAGGLVIPPAINIIRYSSAFLLLLIDLYISIIKSNTSILFIVSCFSSSIISGNNSYIISISISLIRRYLDIILYVKVGSAILS
jgi:hypothetical protein